MQNNISISELQLRIANYADMKAYGVLYKLLFNGLYRFSFSMVKSREASEEIVSDAFIKLWQLGTKLNDIENVKAYLYIVTKNFSLNYISRNYKQVKLNIEEVDFNTFISPVNPEESLMSGEAVKIIKESISKLPPQCRIIFQLVKEDGLSYKEVASILDLSVFTVRNQMAIALKKVADSLPSSIRNLSFVKTGFSLS